MTLVLFESSIKPLLGLSGAILTTLVVATPSFSSTLSFTTTRADISSNDQLDWASLGPIVPPQLFKVLPFAFTATSGGGLQVGVNVPPTGDPAITPPLLFQTTANGLPTNFAADDFILLTGLNPSRFPAPGNPGPLILSFETPVKGGGTQIAVDDTSKFIASISAFDRDNNLLGNFSAAGTSSLALDNSALFLGVHSDEANLSRLEFTTSVADRAVGINKLSIEVATVPEPSGIGGIILFGLGLVVANQAGALKKKNELHLKHGLPSTHPLRGPELRGLRQLQREYPDSPCVFISERKGPMTAADAGRKMIRQAGQLAELPFSVHPHMV